VLYTFFDDLTALFWKPSKQIEEEPLLSDEPYPTDPPSLERPKHAEPQFQV
jgi:hypothetical protein